MRSFRALLGGIGRFVPCVIIAFLDLLVGRSVAMGLHQRSERVLGWPFLMTSWSSSDTLLGLFLHFLAGTLPLRYCAANVISTWRLPPGGGVAGLVMDGGDGAGFVRVKSRDQGVLPVCMLVLVVIGLVGLVEVVNEFDWKNSCTPREDEFHAGSQSSIRVWKRTRILRSQTWEHDDAERRCVCINMLLEHNFHRDKVGVG